MANNHEEYDDYYDSDREYVQTRIPDKLRLSELLKKCKGSDRTMAQYAEECGTISPSTLSRILNGKITKPLTIEFLKTIYDHRDPKADVSFHALCSANGMIDKETLERRSRGDAQRRFDSKRDLENNIRSFICNELFDRGVTLKSGYRFLSRGLVGEDGKAQFLPYGIIRKSDFMISLPEMKEDAMWAFVICPYTEAENECERDFSFSMERFIERVEPNLLYDAWGIDGKGTADSEHEIKTSFVFCDERYYNTFRKLMEKVVFHTSMTTILVDVKNQSVLCEEWLNSPRKNKHVSLFELKKDTYDGDWTEELTLDDKEGDE